MGHFTIFNHTDCQDDSCQKLWKVVKICRSCGQNTIGLFFWTRCRMEVTTECNMVACCKKDSLPSCYTTVTNVAGNVFHNTLASFISNTPLAYRAYDPWSIFKYNTSMNITRNNQQSINIKKTKKTKKQLVVSNKQIHFAPLNTLNVNADITKLLQLLPDQNMWKIWKIIVNSDTF